MARPVKTVRMRGKSSAPFLVAVGIGCRPAYLPWLRAWLPAINRCVGRGFSRPAVWRSTVALIEAVTNAITHGDDGDPDRRIWITCTVHRRTLRLAVADRGRPFRIPRRISPPPLAQLRGRGLYLMRSLMHGVRCRRRNGYNIVEMIYHDTSV